jgi:succinate-semialdehyde dehydrogenase/glutarate-semialdehyde dehydrogenase
MSYTQLGLYIDGKWNHGNGGGGEDVINPATQKSLAHLPHATTSDLDAALAAADKGFKLWKAKSAYDRGRIIKKAADLLRERADQVARSMTQEQGKVFAEAKGEVLTSADIVEWFAEEGRRAYGRIIPSRNPTVRQMVVTEPVGVVAAFTPWNFPVLTPARKVAASLAAGCSIIIKASEETPAGCVDLVKCFEDAGVPAGVINLVFGVPAKVSEHLIASPIVRKISFTGSVPVGKHLAQLAAKGMKRATMELGGHSPVVVFGDADPEKTADTISAFKYRNAGQVCISPTRFYVQENVYDRFLKRFTDNAKAIKLGDGLEKDTTMGPLANARRLDAMDSFVADAKSRGGKVVAGGSRSGNQGFFFEPTVVTDVPDDSKIMTEEPFGPVAPIVTFKTFDEVVERANSLEFGLAAYTFTSSPKTATAIGDALQSGMVGVNSVAISTPETPFGGIKDSGYGHEGGIEGLEVYMNKKFIAQA